MELHFWAADRCCYVESNRHTVSDARFRQYLHQFVVGGPASRHECSDGADRLCDGEKLSLASGANIGFGCPLDRDSVKSVGHREFLPETLTNTILGHDFGELQAYVR
jgi:hypothetical protein